MEKVLEGFDVYREVELYNILKHSTEEERLTLCKHNKFKAMCKMIDFDTYSKKHGQIGLQQYGKTSFKIILESFPDFTDGLAWIQAIKPGFIYTDEFENYVNGYLEIKKRKTHDGQRYKEYNLENRLYRAIFQNGHLLLEEWFLDEHGHKTNGPSEIVYYENGRVKMKHWCIDGVQHRTDGPAFIKYYENGRVQKESWYIDGKLSSKCIPAKITYDENGNVLEEEYYRKGRKI